MPETLPPTPTPTDNTLSGGVWVSGAGFDQSSGTPIDYAEYRQWMTIDYTRNPRYTTPASDTTYRSLAQVSATDTNNVNTTRLHYNVTVHNSCTFLSGTYDLSAAYQPQKFVVMANKFDKVGYEYGDVSGPNNLFVFGPQGSILTTQPYVRRKPLESTDVEYSLTQMGTTDGYVLSAPVNNYIYGTGDNIAQPYSIYLRDHWDIMGGNDWPHSNFEAVIADQFWMAGGAYSTTSEPGYGSNTAGLQKLISFIEKVGACLSATVYNWRFVVPTPTHSNTSVPSPEDRLDINPYYSTAFHDYS